MTKEVWRQDWEAACCAEEPQNDESWGSVHISLFCYCSVCVMYMNVDARALACVWRSEATFGELSLSFTFAQVSGIEVMSAGLPDPSFLC